MNLPVMALDGGWASAAGRPIESAWTPKAGASARPTAWSSKRRQRCFLNWAALTPALSQREREQRQPQAAAAWINSTPSAAMARADFPSPLDVPRSAGRGAGAQRSMRASCSDSLRMSERSAKREASSAAPPRARASQVAPQGTRPVGPPFLWLLSFGGAKESDCAAGRTSRPTAPPPLQPPSSALKISAESYQNHSHPRRRRPRGISCIPPSSPHLPPHEDIASPHPKRCRSGPAAGAAGCQQAAC